MVPETRASRSFGSRRDGNADRVGFDAGNLDGEGLWRNFEFHALSNSFAAPDAAGRDGAEKLSVLHHVDPAGGRQVDGVPTRRKRALEYREARKSIGRRAAFRRRRQVGFGGQAQADGRCCRKCRLQIIAGHNLEPVRRGQCRPLPLDRPFELVAAAGFFRRRGRNSSKQDKRDQQSRAHAQSTAIMTSEAFTTTITLSLALMPSSSTASLVIEEVTIWPLPMSTRICEVVAPFLTSRTVPLIWLRALMRMTELTMLGRARPCHAPADRW